MHNRKRTIWTGIFALLLLVLAGCNSNTGSEVTEDVENASAREGYFRQEKLTLPAGETYLLDVALTEEGKIIIVGENGIYTSEDLGDSWQEEDYGSEILSGIMDDSQGRMETATIAADGTIFLCYLHWEYLSEDRSNDDLDVTYRHYIIAPDGTEQELEQVPDPEEGYLTDVRFLDDGNLIAAIEGEEVCRLDGQTGEVITVYTGSSQYDDFIIYRDQLLVMMAQNVLAYDLETGETVEADVLPAVYTYLDIERSDWSHMFVEDVAGETLYITDCSTGIYQISMNSGVPERVLDGEGYALSNLEFIFKKIFAWGEAEFIAWGIRSEAELLYYSWSEEPINEVAFTVYSLMENEDMQSAVTSFREQYPEYRVTYEYSYSTHGRTSSELPLSDELKVLNTKIMAGDGPDVLVMEGLPAESYMESGVLADIRDVIETAEQEQSFFENVLYTYERDGAVYAVPTRFTVPVLMGPEEQLAQITDLKTLAEQSVKIKAESGELRSVLGEFWDIGPGSLLLQGSANALINDSGTMDEAALRAFLEYAGTIWKENGIDHQGLEAYASDEKDEYSYNYSEFTSLNDAGILYTLLDLQPLMICSLTDVDEFNVMFSLQKELDWSFKGMPGLEENVYRARMTLGINAKSEQQEAAAAFITYMLSRERQTSDLHYGGGLPVSIDAYDENASIYLEAEEIDDLGSYGYAAIEEGKKLEAELPFHNGTEEEFEELKRFLAGLDTPVLENTVVVTAVTEQLVQYVSGNVELDEAVNAVTGKVNLYLAE